MFFHRRATQEMGYQILIGESFWAETQAAIADASRDKYTAGKNVYVRYDPNGDRQQVALERAV